MRQVSIVFIFILFLASNLMLTTHSAIKGKIDYSIPIDYSKLSEDELNIEANKYFHNAVLLKDGIVNEDMTNALTIYTILENIDPDNVEYCAKLGILYDKLGKDRFAKGKFSKAICIDSKHPKPYYYFAKFYYKREMYRKALKYYNEAYKCGFDKNYDLLYNVGDIHEKFGDTRSALKYFRDAEKISPNPELKARIKKVEAQDTINYEYYSDTRLRKQ